MPYEERELTFTCRLCNRTTVGHPATVCGACRRMSITLAWLRIKSGDGAVLYTHRLREAAARWATPT